MTPLLPSAVVRTRIRLPMRLADGFQTTADVVTFEGLADRGGTWLWCSAARRGLHGLDLGRDQQHSEELGFSALA